MTLDYQIVFRGNDFIIVFVIESIRSLGDRKGFKGQGRGKGLKLINVMIFQIFLVQILGSKGLFEVGVIEKFKDLVFVVRFMKRKVC